MNRFRCQYQKGSDYVSETIESQEPISSSQILYLLAKLALSVRDKYGKPKGEKVALKVLQIHEFIIKSIHGRENYWNGPLNSYYLDRRNKNKLERSERVDLEFYGEYGHEDEKSPLNDYIKRYRKSKHWIRFMS